MSFYSNSIFIITGAASGMGKAMTEQCLQNGATVFALDIRAELLQQLSQRFPNAHLHTQILDVSDATAIADFADRTIPLLNGKTLVLINNAGVALATGRFIDTPLSDFEWLLNINLWGVIRMTKAFLPYMLKTQKGRIVNLSSVFGLAGVANQSAYSTSKFGVRGFSDVLRMELHDTPIKVTTVHPGGVKTNITRFSKMGGKVFTSKMMEETISRFDEIAKTSPEKAAGLILKAAEKGQARLIIGADGRLFEWITRLFPTAYIGMIKFGLEKRFGDIYDKHGIPKS
ncbi:MAG: SDR family NAD(P)-dependent oxidoreductase [Bacteroidia bacterium]|nr:SDR family NAD(P)-dependent oxidoreductase [Bacteroidia bacterium]